MAWQKSNNSYHFVNVYPYKMLTLCGKEIHAAKDFEIYPHPDDRCAICEALYRLTYSTVYDGMQYLKSMSDIDILNRAMTMSKSKQLVSAIEVRIRKLTKQAEHDRKLRLIEKAYE
jgi:hypothetical protein